MVKSRVVLADDHRPFRETLRSMLDRDPDIEVTGETANGTEVLELLRLFHPDVIVMDVRMPGADGIATLKQLLAAQPSVKVIILSVTSEPIFASEMLGAGARGYVTKADTGELPRAIHAVVKGERYLSTEVAPAMVSAGAPNAKR